MRSEVQIAAYAKINLALAVSPPRARTLADGTPDPRAGWHEISSLFACVGLSDDLVLRAAGETLLDIGWAPDAPRASKIDWPIEKDLAFRAHGLVQAHAGRRLPVHAKLLKRIPVGGGLGGGSSDAAAMIRGLDALFGLNLSDADACAMASRLGSDVAFFLDSGRGEPDRGGPSGELAAAPRPALVEGFGERITRLERIESNVLLIIPPVACPTPKVYAAFDRRLASEPGFRFRCAEMRELAAARGGQGPESWFNDLAGPACDVAPELAGIREIVERHGRPVHVTGSGSTLFVMPAPGAAVVRQLERDLGDRGVVVRTRLV